MRSRHTDLLNMTYKSPIKTNMEKSWSHCPTFKKSDGVGKDYYSENLEQVWPSLEFKTRDYRPETPQTKY